MRIYLRKNGKQMFFAREPDKCDLLRIGIS